MWFFILIGLFCFLLVIGTILRKNPLHFALSGLVVLGALAFVGFIALIIWAVTAAH